MPHSSFRQVLSRRARACFFAVLSLTACTVVPGNNPPGTVCDTCGVCEQTLLPLSATHVLGPIDYPDPPPTGGEHNPCWAKWGVHHDVVAPEHWVHNLEHGGIVFLYRSRADVSGGDGGTTDAGVAGAGSSRKRELADIEALVQTLPRTLSTEYADLPKAFAVVSWGHRLVSDCVDLKAAKKFYAEHFNHGLEDIPDDPTCE